VLSKKQKKQNKKTIDSVIKHSDFTCCLARRLQGYWVTWTSCVTKKQQAKDQWAQR